jgi:hypothetical protein
MTTINDWDIPTKAPMRSVMTRITKTRPIEMAGFLPATHGLCVLEAYRQGTIELHTKLFLFDTSKDVMSEAIENLRGAGFTRLEPIIDCALQAIPDCMRMQSFKPDFVYLDLCGEYNTKVLATLQKIAKACPVSLTTIAGFRTSKEKRYKDLPIGFEGYAEGILCNKSLRKQHNFQGIDPLPATRISATKIVASINNGVAGRGRLHRQVRFADIYQGKSKRAQMLGLHIDIPSR